MQREGQRSRPDGLAVMIEMREGFTSELLMWLAAPAVLETKLVCD
jgi:hypothetical protein